MLWLSGLASSWFSSVLEEPRAVSQNSESISLSNPFLRERGATERSLSDCVFRGSCVASPWELEVARSSRTTGPALGCPPCPWRTTDHSASAGERCPSVPTSQRGEGRPSVPASQRPHIPASPRPSPELRARPASWCRERPRGNGEVRVGNARGPPGGLPTTRPGHPCEALAVHRPRTPLPSRHSASHAAGRPLLFLNRRSVCGSPGQAQRLPAEAARVLALAAAPVRAVSLGDGLHTRSLTRGL